MADISTIIESKLKSGEINGLATEFNGTDEYVVLPNSESLQPELLDFSFMARFTQAQIAGNKVLLGFINGSEKLLFGWYNGRPTFQYDDGIDSFTTTAGAQFIDLDEYFTLAYSCDRSANIKSFVDGVLYVSEDFTPVEAVNMEFTEDLNIGSAGATFFHKGLIDELILWKGRAMSDAEMTTKLYNNGRSIDPTQKEFYDTGADQILSTVGTSRGGYLAAWYKMGDGDTAPFIKDHGEEGNNGNMINLDETNFKNNTAG